MNDDPKPTAACLDAETLAAWVDGGLSGAARSDARTHVADCARCQAVLAVMVRTETAGVAPAAARPALGWLGWLVPLAAAATALAIWVAVPRAPVPTLAPASIKEEAAPVAQSAPDQQAADLKARDAAPKNAARAEARNQEKKQAKERDELARSNKLQDRFASRDAGAAAPTAPPATPPAVASERAAGRLGAAQAFIDSVEIVSPDPLVRWRIRAVMAEKSVDAGKTWEPVATGVTAELTTGAATSSSVCWLVGRAGVVLLTTDGRIWRRLAFPEATDLSAVRATDGRTAVVTTVDGREFATIDAGLTWVRR